MPIVSAQGGGILLDVQEIDSCILGRRPENVHHGIGGTVDLGSEPWIGSIEYPWSLRFRDHSQLVFEALAAAEFIRAVARADGRRERVAAAALDELHHFVGIC